MHQGKDGIAIILLFVGALTDAVDGIIARRMNMVTELGKALDPIADKVAVFALAGYMAIFRDFPWWLLPVIVLRDIVISTMAVRIKKATGIVPGANDAGKVAISLLALLLLGHMADIDTYKVLFLWSGVGMLIYSFVVYVNDYIKIREEYSASIDSNKRVI